MKKIKSALLLLPLMLVSCANNALPKAEPMDGYRGEMFGIDKHINEETIDNYLNRSDTVYRDMRMLIDPANYEALPGGDSYLSGFVKGFEAVPMPLIIEAFGLPPEVGASHQGPFLFKLVGEHYVANYKESLEIMEFLFPKDKNIFLMWGGGGYAGMTKTLLIDLGWNKDVVYNVGAYWSYEGTNDVKVKRVNEQGEVVYDFYKVPFHDITFDDLTEI